MTRTLSRWLADAPAFLIVVGLAGVGIGSLSAGRAEEAKNSPQFEKDVLPLFQAKCFRCHGPDMQKAGLDVRTKSGLLRGGESGPALVPGSADKSVLWEKLSKDKMPPGRTKLSDAEKQLVKAWINGGAAATEKVVVASAAPIIETPVTEADRNFWSFRPPARPPVPAVKEANRVRNPIDSFILAALEKKGLTLSPETDRLTLLRRAYFDLIGLPPSPKEIAEYLADSSADAYERLVDRLLSSKHYGERWGRHWLDLAGYADSEGILDADYVRAAAWRYRDYVIQSFNNDKPYDRFLREQIAGDELVKYWEAQSQKGFSPEVLEGLTATGFLRCASTSRPDFVNIKNAPGYYYQTLDDTLKIVVSSTMGITLECARCHTHKYDPIPQSEYYRVQAVFMSAYRPGQWVPQNQRRVQEVTEAGRKSVNEKVDARIDELRKQVDDLKKEFAGHLFTGRLAKLPVQIRDDVRKAFSAPAAKRNEIQKYLVSKFEKELVPDPKTLDRVLPETFKIYKSRLAEIENGIKAENANRAAFPEIRALYDLPGEPKTYLLRRGDYQTPGPEVQPGVLTALATPKSFAWSPPAKDAKSTFRRSAFAEWLTQPDHPLTARVLVNRLWLLHFGEGIVSTPDNFGHMGSPPSHPELLDWLATEFVARGWSIKAMHRMMVTSSTYRQSSTINPVLHSLAKKVDPEDRLMWRQRLRRLEAESVRDSVLCVAGTLNREMFGAPVPMMRQADGEVTEPAEPTGGRRSIYLQVRRSQPLTLLQAFDQPVMETNCTRRGVSTVSSQALDLLNSDFLIRQAEAFAGRVLKEKPRDPAGHAVYLAFGRQASEKERVRLTAFLDKQAALYGKESEAGRRALADVCQMLLNSNEFLYVD